MEGINIIVAMTKNKVIGKDGKMLWHLKEDMKLFKEKTIEATVIMGRKTWDSIPEKFRPLQNRHNIILSNSLKEVEGAEVCNSIEKALKNAKKIGKEVYCIGGARVYEEFLPHTNVLHISWVKKNYEGNVFFPKINFENWKEIETKNFDEFTYKKYIKNK
jgi:dihydrofolate reductase